MRKEDEFADLMKLALDDGTYPPGTVLPAQRELAAQYGFDVRDVRAAMRRLEAAGLVKIRQKAGTLVLDPAPVRRLGIERYARHRWMQGVAPLESDMSAANDGKRVAVDQRNEVETVAASTEVAAALDIAEGEAVVRRARRLFDQSGQPTHSLASYYRVNDVIGTPLMETEPGTAGRGGGFAVLHARGLTPARIQEDIEVRPPTDDEASELDVPPTMLIVELWRWVWTADGRPIEYATGIHNPHKFRWSYRFEVPE